MTSRNSSNKVCGRSSCTYGVAVVGVTIYGDYVSSGWLATWLDIEMLVERIGGLPPPHTPDHKLPDWRGPDLSLLLAGRRLCRYVSARQVGSFTAGSLATHWVTPTPYSPDEVTSFLFLPDPLTRREHVLLLDPGRIVHALGPRQMIAARGIEFLLPHGFPAAAVIDGWEMEVR